jgi:chaperone required for assembly of F1-ATPase
MKRFWKAAQIVVAGDGYGVELDGRPVKLPSGQPLIAPFLPLAEAIAGEWGVAPPTFSPEDLPLTRLASTAQERIAPHRTAIVGQLAAYGMNDLLCYQADGPDELVARQNEVWGRWRDWAETNYGLQLQTTAGLIPINQPPHTGEKLHGALICQSNYTIASLGIIVPALGSLLLGLALTSRTLDAQTACDIAFLDELWQEEQWGTDRDAVLRRAKAIEDVAVSTRFMYLCNP